MKFNSTILALLVLFMVSSCSDNRDEQKDSTMNYSEKIAKLVSKVTSGPIRSTDKIMVWFNQDLGNVDKVGNELKGNIFTFEPSIEGKTYWLDSKILVFEPNEPLEYRENFNAKLDIKKVTDKLKGVENEKLVFQFRILGRELLIYKGNLTLKEKNNPNLVNYRGKIVFTEDTKIENLQEAISLNYNNKEYPLNIFAEPDNKSFTFISGDIIRDKITKDFKLTIKKEPLDLTDDFSEEFQVTTLSELKIVDVKKLEDDIKPKIRIEFSDEIDFDQKLKGLVVVENQPDVKIQKNGSSLLLDGNFKYGEEYSISIEQGLRSIWGTRLKNKFSTQIKFKDLKPQISFASDGVFLPETNQYKLQFYTSNLKRVHIEVKKVFENSLADFLSSEKINSSSERKEAFRNTYINRVGVIIHNETIEISSEKNKTLLSEIDLSDLVKSNENGLYLVRLNFNPRDMLVNEGNNKYRYIEEEGQIYKPLFFSNIGLTCKLAGNKYYVYATDIITAKPLEGVKLSLSRLYGNKDFENAKTNNEGMATFVKNHRYYYGDSYIKAEKNGQRSVIKFNEMEWNISGFDVGGVDQRKSGIKTFIYSERGVYRPGDEINLSFIARHIDKDFPDNHPVTLSLFNPQRKKVYELTNKVNKDGFFNFTIQTNENDQTGNWRAQFNIGNESFSHTLKIETIVPYRLKVKITPEHKKLLWNHKALKFNIQCNYLFGIPGAELPLNVEIDISRINKNFAEYKNFIFSNPTFDFKRIKKNIFKGKLDQKGSKDIVWDLPSFNNLPSALNIKTIATVNEKGGRPNKNWINIPVEPYSHYVGLQSPKRSYLATGSDVDIPVILVNTNGKAVAGKTIKYRIYRNSKYWWWHYGREKKLKYKSDYSTVLVKEGELTSKKTHTNINFVPIDKGSYFVEVIDESGTGHSSGIFIVAYPYGGSPRGDKNAGTLTLTSDKEKYFIGEEAVISFPVPKEGSILFTVEKFNSILSEKWYYPNGKDVMEIKVPITKKMFPNSYVTVSIIQPHSQTINDRPIRTFGILPITVEDKETKHFIDIKTTSQFRPKEDFVINLQTNDHKQTQFTIAVVDEGLLDITQYKTPNPWSYFFKKIRLAVKTYDIFSHIISANAGDIFKTFSIGGDMDYRESQLQPEKSKKRFKPVSLFKGPIMTDENGRAKVKFKMPNYVGSVRIVVIGARKNSYARAEKTVPVKTELMILPTLPRVIGPGEKFTIPVSVFAMKDNLGEVNIKVSTKGPLSVNGSNIKTLNFETTEDKDCFFNITTKPEVGQAKIVVLAKSGNYSASYNVDLMVRPSSARIYKSEDYKIGKGDNLQINIPGDGIKGTNRATLTLSNFPNINFGHRLKWLMHYPYGCIEQTTSSVFPQLFLKSFIKYPEAYSERIDKNISAGLERLRRFQILSGAFSYWPYGTKGSGWGTLYAGHFMIEAKKLGYHTSEDLYLNWLNFSKRAAKNHSGSLMTRVYRSYILAIDGNAELSEMNALKESQLDSMNNPQKWLLAATYKLAGLPIDAEMIVSNLGTTVKDYNEFAGTYGSAIRDKAMMLEAMVILEKFDIADEITKEISSVIASNTWYSTQTIGYSLLAIGKYMNSVLDKNKKLIIKGYIEDNRGNKIPFNNEKTFDINITDGFGQPLNIFIDSETTTEKIYATLAWNGVPLKSNVKDENKNLKLSVDWFDEDGEKFDPSEIKQGTTFYGKFTVENISKLNHIDEVALVQILPSGWEIVNTRLLNESLPTWTNNFQLNRQEYLDIRDDRIMWFFDLYKYWLKKKLYRKQDFIVKISAVTIGEFDLPGTITEAMYNNHFKASKAGNRVKVTKP